MSNILIKLNTHIKKSNIAHAWVMGIHLLIYIYIPGKTPTLDGSKKCQVLFYFSNNYLLFDRGGEFWFFQGKKEDAIVLNFIFKYAWHIWFTYIKAYVKKLLNNFLPLLFYNLFSLYASRISSEISYTFHIYQSNILCINARIFINFQFEFFK